MNGRRSTDWKGEDRGEESERAEEVPSHMNKGGREKEERRN